MAKKQTHSKLASDALARAIEKAGGVVALSKLIGVKSQAISQWDKVPPLRVRSVEQATGIPRHELRPDIFA